MSKYFISAMQFFTLIAMLYMWYKNDQMYAVVSNVHKDSFAQMIKMAMNYV